jgi:MYXO-CTERM domain-containing protein
MCHDPAMPNPTTVLFATGPLLLAGVLGGLMLRDRRRPPSQRATHVGHAIAALVAVVIGVAVLALAFLT